MMKIRSPVALIGAVLISLAAGFLGSLVTVTGQGSWYSQLLKPEFTPPNWAFGPVWTTLYILMGIALYLVWIEGISKKEVKVAVAFFAVQLGANALWSFLFFGLESPLYGLAGILALWILILATIVVFYRVRPIAAYLLVPYLLWVSIASWLNYSIFVLNP